MSRGGVKAGLGSRPQSLFSLSCFTLVVLSQLVSHFVGEDQVWGVGFCFVFGSP